MVIRGEVISTLSTNPPEEVLAKTLTKVKLEEIIEEYTVWI